MKEKIFIGILCLAFVLGGCATMRKSIVDVSESDIKNIDAAVQASENFLYDWPFYSGLIRSEISKAVMDEEFPKSFPDSLKFLDEMSADCKKGEDGVVDCGLEDWIPSDYEGEFPFKDNPEAIERYAAGAHFGIKIKMAGELIWKTLEKYAGDIFKLLPPLF